MEVLDEHKQLDIHSSPDIVEETKVDAGVS